MKTTAKHKTSGWADSPLEAVMGIVRSWTARNVVLATLVAGIVLQLPALAQGGETSPVEVTLSVRKVIFDEEGRRTFVAADQARPGEILEYTAEYRNISEFGVSNLQPTLPIPAGVRYIENTAAPRRVEASLDGQNFAPPPLVKKVIRDGGEPVEVEASPEEYRSLRWFIGDLAPGKTVTVRAQVRLETPLLSQQTAR
jgi:uncharacterized repeat protein (TIGR01451 family)